MLRGLWIKQGEISITFDGAPFGPKYPTQLGADVAKWRAVARTRDIGRDGMRRYGEAVGEAIRKLQRTELMRCLTRTPALNKPAIPRPKNPCLVAYSKPNPFRMVGDPAERSEENLYKQLLRYQAINAKMSPIIIDKIDELDGLTVLEAALEKAVDELDQMLLEADLEKAVDELDQMQQNRDDLLDELKSLCKVLDENIDDLTLAGENALKSALLTIERHNS